MPQFCKVTRFAIVDERRSMLRPGIITHYAPLPVLTCVVQTLLIRNALLHFQEIDRPPTLDDIQRLLRGPWQNWQENTTDPGATAWLEKVGKRELKLAETRLLEELKDFAKFDPYHQDYRSRSGYCVLTLKICLWALHWSFQEDHPPVPDWLPTWPFERHGFDGGIMWIVLIGADADTYGASGGPLLAAYHPNINKDFLKGLLLRPLIDKYLKASQERQQIATLHSTQEINNP